VPLFKQTGTAEQQFFPVELSVLESTDLLGAIGAARFKSL
jgi:hypothetical protein